VLELSPLKAAVWTLPSFGSFILGSMLAPAIVRRIRPAYVMAVGLAIGAVGMVVLTQVAAESGLTVLVSASVVYSLGLAPLFTLTNDLIIGAAPPERAGAASAISETGAELGGALSIAIRPSRLRPPATLWAAPSPRAASYRRPWPPRSSRPPASRSRRGSRSSPCLAPPSRPWRPWRSPSFCATCGQPHRQRSTTLQFPPPFELEPFVRRGGRFLVTGGLRPGIRGVSASCGVASPPLTCRCGSGGARGIDCVAIHASLVMLGRLGQALAAPCDSPRNTTCLIIPAWLRAR
jgi:hypothetical protein